MTYTNKENVKFTSIRDYIQSLRDFLNKNELPPDTDIEGLFTYLGQIKAITGNPANWQSFLSVMLAKKWLYQNFEIGNFDAGNKHENTPGLDIDVKTRDGQRIIGEVKATTPATNTNFGSNQLKKIHEDFAKLNEADAQHKFFFVTDARAYEYVTTKYQHKIPDVTVILLMDRSTQGQTQ